MTLWWRGLAFRVTLRPVYKSHSLLTRHIHSQMELKIQLNETEQKICDLLDECALDFKEQKGITTSCRIAGGWVRDKVRFSAVNS
jgi:hypothetical protein